ncbi:MAG: hypothetical protein AAF750_10640 [Planctomycetota bacterium]
MSGASVAGRRGVVVVGRWGCGWEEWGAWGVSVGGGGVVVGWGCAGYAGWPIKRGLVRLIGVKRAGQTVDRWL